MLTKTVKALEKIEPTKHPVVDPLILGSTMLYVNVGGEMRETIETRFGAAYIITANKGLRNDKWEGIAKGEQKSFDELFADFETEVFPKLEGCPKDATAKTIFDISKSHFIKSLIYSPSLYKKV